jgi:hypothetical protein
MGINVAARHNRIARRLDSSADNLTDFGLDLPRSYNCFHVSFFFG